MKIIMKKVFVLLGFLCSVAFMIQVKASSWYFLWEEDTTVVEVPLGGNLQNYIHIPKAMLYRDDVALKDAEIHYITTGDWLYLLTDVDTSKVGEYQVWYKAIENKYQPGQCNGYKTIVTFKVVDLERPVILECPEKITYLVGATKPDYKSKIIATDNSGAVTIRVDDTSVDYSLIGNYQVKVEVSDGAFIETKQIELEVTDPKGPVVTCLDENDHIVLDLNSKVSLASHFKAMDRKDGDVTSSIRYSPFSTTEEKTFPLSVSFQDSDGNITSVEVQIEIIDHNIPLIELFQTNLVLDYNEDYEEALTKNIKRAILGTVDITEDVMIDTGNLKKEVGNYTISYSYSKHDKQAYVSCTVHMLSSQGPVILVENVETPKGQKVSLQNYIQVVDASDAAINNKITFDDSGVDYTKEGVYPVLVSATNSSNLTTNETIYVTVIDPKTEKNGVSYSYIIPILFGVVILSAGVVIFLYFKKRRNCNHKENTI